MGWDGVRYAEIIDTPDSAVDAYQADGDMIVSLALIISLQWWPNPGMGLMYGIGD